MLALAFERDHRRLVERDEVVGREMRPHAQIGSKRADRAEREDAVAPEPASAEGARVVDPVRRHVAVEPVAEQPHVVACVDEADGPGGPVCDTTAGALGERHAAVGREQRVPTRRRRGAPRGGS